MVLLSRLRAAEVPKMVVHASDILPALYDEDETAWLENMAGLAREGRLAEIDLPNLAEFLSDMAKRDRREVVIRLTLLIAHILNWTSQPEKRSGSWQATILTQQHDLQDVFESRTLRNHAEANLSRCYGNAVEQAAAETGLGADTFPAECPYSLDELRRIDLSAE